MCVAGGSVDQQCSAKSSSKKFRFLCPSENDAKKIQEKKSQPRFLAILRMTIKVYTMYFVIHSGLFGMYHFLTSTQFLELKNRKFIFT